MGQNAKEYSWFRLFLLVFLLLFIAFLLFSANYITQRLIKGLGILLVQGELTQVYSPSDGVLDSWLIEEGDAIKKNQILARLRTDNNFINILAPKDGLMAEIIIYAQSQLKKGDSLALITNEADVRHHLELIGFVSSLEGKKISKGMKALVWPSISEAQKNGAIFATVKQVGKLPITKAALQSIIKIPGLAKYIRNKIEAEPFLVVLTLDKDSNQKTGYKWTKIGPSFELDSGIIANFDIIYDEKSLLKLSFPALYGKSS